MPSTCIPTSTGLENHPGCYTAQLHAARLGTGGQLLRRRENAGSLVTRGAWLTPSRAQCPRLRAEADRSPGSVDVEVWTHMFRDGQPRRVSAAGPPFPWWEREDRLLARVCGDVLGGPGAPGATCACVGHMCGTCMWDMCGTHVWCVLHVCRRGQTGEGDSRS